MVLHAPPRGARLRLARDRLRLRRQRVPNGNIRRLSRLMLGTPLLIK
jgi:hypothetical protein